MPKSELCFICVRGRCWGIELQIEMENDKNLIWRGDGQANAAGTTYRLIVNFQFRRTKVVLGKLPQTS